ncbi:uncharacterized protein LOC118747793 isoform X4 [Rhagoletis pomonella]|uniref:uncharacterized protein LOC118747793 isoform X4 n=2 Tax=Rhagoletis pomonella TaxID=28610 RepID=UPI00177E670A|nr:uncharacterized protein LOC118747793 isoform X4 [Rhagoletis pomonella]
MRIRYVNAQYPGSNHDSHIWNISNARYFFEKKYLDGERNTWLLGDAGYALEPWLMTLFRSPPSGSPEEKGKMPAIGVQPVVEVQALILPRFHVLPPRRISLMREPPPPPPPKPKQQTVLKNIASDSPIPSKYPQSDCNLIKKIDSSSTITASGQYQLPNFYVNARYSSVNNSMTGNNNYSSLLCHANSNSSPTAVRKREKLLHRFSDAATLGRKLKKKKNTNRTCRSMTEAIEMLADPVTEDEFFTPYRQHKNGNRLT